MTAARVTLPFLQLVNVTIVRNTDDIENTRILQQIKGSQSESVYIGLVVKSLEKFLSSSHWVPVFCFSTV